MWRQDFVLVHVVSLLWAKLATGELHVKVPATALMRLPAQVTETDAKDLPCFSKHQRALLKTKEQPNVSVSKHHYVFLLEDSWV